MSSNEHLFKIAEAGEGNENHGGGTTNGAAVLTGTTGTTTTTGTTGTTTTTGITGTTATTGTTGTTATTGTPGATLFGGEGSEIHGTGGETLIGTGGANLVSTSGTNTFNVVAGQNTLTGVNPDSDHINVSSGATAVLNLTTPTANLSTSTTNNSGTLLINAAPATTSTITGSTGSDDIIGGTGAVTVHESAGDDIINGGTGGTNTVVYNNVTSGSLALNPAGTATVQKASLGTDTLHNVQRIQFADSNVALDINGNAGTTAKVLGAVFGAGAVSNPAYVGIGLHDLDSGMSYAGLMQLALNAAGATTSTAEVNLLWSNLFGAAPTAAQAAPYVAMLDSGATTAAALGTMAADSSVNTANINLVGLQHTGIHYI